MYGVQWLWETYAVDVGMYYDRGTRLDGRKQYWPFDYFLAGTRAQGRYPLWSAWYAAYDASMVAHRNQNTPMPYIDLSGHLDVGWTLSGEKGHLNTFMRLERLSNYQYLGDTPAHLLLIGLEIWGGSNRRDQWF